MSTRRLLAPIVCVLAVGATVRLVGRAAATGTPHTPLYYGGYLEDDGLPVLNPRTLQINIWDDPTSTDSGAHLKCFLAPTVTSFDKGRFRVALPDACTAVVTAQPTLWVEVIVDSHALPRSRIGAVPFAVQAASVPWSGLDGVDAQTEWPGTIPYARVANPPDVAALEARVATLETRRPIYVNRATNSQYSMDAGYCGRTAPTTGFLVESGALGYAAAKLRCEKACNSPTAHICTGEELVRHLQTGGAAPPTPGWYAAGIAAEASGGTIFDCSGFTSNLSTQFGLQFQVAPSVAGCDGAQPINCCD
jgi:hypothetical protein